MSGGTVSWELLDTPSPSTSTSTDLPPSSTARDLKIDLNTRELAVENGDLVIVYDTDAIKQDIDMALRMFKGECFFATDKGVPYFDRVLVKSPDPEQIRSTLRDAILARRGVISLVTLDLNFNRAARKLIVTWAVTTDLGPLNGSTVIAR